MLKTFLKVGFQSERAHNCHPEAVIIKFANCFEKKNNK